MPKLFLMMGCPGSGKTTFAKNVLKQGTYISRDEIRFQKVKENEEYFSKENEVFAEFINQINTALERGEDVLADATHLNRASRKKVLNKVKGYDCLGIIHVRPGLQEALNQNELRKGTRSYVPRSVVRRMWHSIEEPTYDEGFNIIWTVWSDYLTGKWYVQEGE